MNMSHSFCTGSIPLSFAPNLSRHKPYFFPWMPLFMRAKNYACRIYFWLNFTKKPATLSNRLKEAKISIQVALSGSSNSGLMPSSSHCSSIHLLPFCSEILRVRVSAIFLMRNPRTWLWSKNFGNSSSISTKQVLTKWKTWIFPLLSSDVLAANGSLDLAFPFPQISSHKNSATRFGLISCVAKFYP